MSAVFSKVGVIGRSRQQGLGDVLEDLLNTLRDTGAEVLLEDRFGDLTSHGCELHTRDAIGAGADLMIVLGGDGSMLSAARESLLAFGKPMIGVNRGASGFSPISARTR
jgi:NAD+ kinase